MGADDERERLEAEIERLQALVAGQAELIEQLRSKVAELESRLGQDSATSSAPPSRDLTDRRARRAAERAERKAAAKAEGAPARKQGKQPGAPGSTLCRRVPDRTVVHSPSSCGDCGGDLADAPVVGRATRQVLEVPEPRLDVTDHVAERRRCGCGHETAGVFPPEATGPVCWGPRAKAVGAYLLARQHLPLGRCAEAMDVLFAAPMGEGTLTGLLPDAAERLAPFVDRLRRLLAGCPVAHADETSVRVGTKLGWVHTVSTPGLTLLCYHDRRGIDGIVAIGVLTGYRGTIVHDGLSSYDRPELAGATHAQCGAHLLRHLDKAAEVVSQRPWAAAMRALPSGPPPRRKHTGGWAHYQREAWNLATRMRRHEDQVLRLLCDEAERSLRMAKLHDKISGCFRNKDNAEAFLTVRSYLQTGKKHARNALQLLTDLWIPTGAWLPSVAIPDTG